MIYVILNVSAYQILPHLFSYNNKKMVALERGMWKDKQCSLLTAKEHISASFNAYFIGHDIAEIEI